MIFYTIIFYDKLVISNRSLINFDSVFDLKTRI
jgi:hypothetical protein